MTNKALVDLAAQINGLRQQVETLSQPSLGYSSLEDGAIPEFDRAGGQVAQYGTQFDGSHMAASLSGPVPPIPSAPVVTPVAGGLMVRWDGEWADATALTPMDFSRIEVHVSTDPGFDRTSATFLRATIETPRGGDAVIVPLPYVEHTVALVARSLSGKSSVASVPVVGTPTKITQVDLDFDPGTLAGSTIYWGDEPTAPVEGDYWLQPPDNALTRWDGDSWEDVSDLGITEAIQAAAAAQGAADTASGQASAAQAAADLAAGQAAQALTDAQNAQSTADGKAVIYYQASAPAGLTAADLNDLWIDSDDNRKVYRWDGDSWEIADDQRIATAITTATNAQTTAASKVQTFFQTSAPASTGRVVGDLWFDTDDGNKAYRWSGSAWVVVQDAGIASAQTAATNAQSTATNAQTAAQAAQGDADAAATAAQAAQDDADAATTLAQQAQAAADSKVTVYRQATAPTGGTYKPNGDLWIDSDDGMLYVATLTTGGWVASPDQRVATALSTASAANTAVATKITLFAQVSAPSTTGRTTGDIWIDTDDGNKIYNWNGAWTPRLIGAPAISATARDLGAITTYFQISQPTGVLKVGDLWVDTDDNNKSRRYNGSTWDIITDPQIATALANAAAAQSAAGTAQSTADVKITAYYQVSAPPTTGRTVGDLWIDIDDTNKVYRWDGTGSWVATPFGTNAISDGAVTDGKVADVSASKIITGVLRADTRVIAGVEAGSHAELTGGGLYAYTEDPLDGVPNLAVRVGTAENDLFSITDTNGNTMASISDEGVASFQKVYALQDPDIAGSPLLGNLANFQSPTEQQDANPGLLDVLPRGVVGYGVYGNYSTLNGIQGLFEISFQAQPGRTYRITYSGNTFNIGAGAGINSGAMIRLINPTWSPDGIYEAPTPTMANGDVIGYSYAIGYSAARNITIPGRIWTLRCNPMGVSAGGELNAGIVKLLFVIVAQVNMVLNSAELLELVIEDIGPDIPSTRLINTSTSAAPQPSQPTSKTYTTTWNSTNYATYRADGSKRTDTTDVIQGYSSYNGDGEGLWIFPSTIAGVLSGATVKKVEVYAYANHWYYNSGGTAFIKVHGYTSEPATSPSMTTAVTSSNWPKPGGRWVTLPSSFWAGFKSGAYRGFGVGPAGSSNLLYYGRFNGSGAKLRITYTK